MSFLSDPQLIALFWTSYLTISIIVIVELWFTLNRTKEEFEHAFRHQKSDTTVRFEELELQLSNVANAYYSKLQQLSNLCNATMSRLEHTNQLLKQRATVERLAEESTKCKNLEERVYREFRNIYKNAALIHSDNASYEDLATEHMREMNCRFYNRDTADDLVLETME